MHSTAPIIPAPSFSSNNIARHDIPRLSDHVSTALQVRDNVRRPIPEIVRSIVEA